MNSAALNLSESESHHGKVRSPESSDSLCVAGVQECGRCGLSDCREQVDEFVPGGCPGLFRAVKSCFQLEFKILLLARRIHAQAAKPADDDEVFRQNAGSEPMDSDRLRTEEEDSQQDRPESLVLVGIDDSNGELRRGGVVLIANESAKA